MNMNKTITTLIPLFLLANVAISPVYASDLAVSLQGFKSNKGTAIIVLHNKKHSFPENINKAFKIITVKIFHKKAKATFKNVPTGKYAISAIHDNNMNKKLDKNFFGFPKEGVAVSGISKKSMGPPLYKNSEFIFKDNHTINLNIEY